MNNLKTLENELVPVYETETGKKVVYGLELHKILGVKSNYREWIARRFSDIEAIENEDFQAVEIPTPSGQTKKNHIIRLEIAKEMAMLERNDKGKQVRRYFIQIEEKYKEAVQAGITHNVKTPVVTSRDICKMLGKSLQSHGVILREIRDCIAEIEGLGMDRLEFFRDSEYKSTNSGMQPQFLCTEKGLRYFSGRLEPKERKAFIAEYQEWFRFLRGAMEGKSMAELKESQESISGAGGDNVIRIYKNNQWGLLSINGELHNLTPDEMRLFENMIPSLIQKGVKEIPAIIISLLESSGRTSKLEKINEYHCLIGEKAEAPTLPGAEINKRNRLLKVDKTRSLDEVINLTLEDAKTRYRMQAKAIVKIADDIGARVSGGGTGKKILLDRKKLDDYFQSISS